MSTCRVALEGGPWWAWYGMTVVRYYKRGTNIKLTNYVNLLAHEMATGRNSIFHALQKKNIK